MTEPTIVVAGQTIRGVAGTNLAGQVVATLDPTNPFDTSNGFPPAGTTATINWGDGTTSFGTFVADGGQFDVVGSHAYTTFGGFPVVTTITGLGVGYPTSLVAQGSAVIADAVLADTTAGSLLAGVTEGVAVLRDLRHLQRPEHGGHARRLHRDHPLRRRPRLPGDHHRRPDARLVRRQRDEHLRRERELTRRSSPSRTWPPRTARR